MAEEYKIGEVAALAGTTIRTIRYYEEEGLLLPLRTGGGTRLYHQQHLTRLTTILQLADQGFSLESIRQLASIRDKCKTGDQSSNLVSAQLSNELDIISARLSELEHLKKEILQAMKAITKCRGCQNQPTSKGCPQCPVKHERDKIGLLNLIWDQAP